MRVDKVKLKPSINNVLDFDISKINIKYDDNFYTFDSNKWIIEKTKSTDKKIAILSRIPKRYFTKKYPVLLELRHYIHNIKTTYSNSTIIYHLKSFRHFINCMDSINKDIFSMGDIDYDILLQYSELIRRENTNTGQYYKSLIRILNLMNNLPNINVSNDIKNRNYPNIKLPKNKVKHIEYYSESDFLILSNMIKDLLKIYFSENKISKNHSLFIKLAYWYIAMFTGFNETGMNKLQVKSFKIIEENEKKTFYITSEKNRSYKGSQNIIVPITEENSLFERTYNELVNIRSVVKNSKLNIFSYKINNKEIEYLGKSGDFQNLSAVKKYIQEKGINPKPLSTLKIRQFFSNKMYSKTNSEILVSKILGHKKVSTTEKSYFKNQISKDLKFKFNMVQNLMNSFSKDQQFDDWVIFQNAFNIQNITAEELYFKIKNGEFNTALGNCLKDNEYSHDKCKSYINCLTCKNYTLIGDIDIWKILSFKEAIISENNSNYNWIIDLIDQTLDDVDIEIIKKARLRLLNFGKYPFWRNKIMVKTILEEYEK